MVSAKEVDENVDMHTNVPNDPKILYFKWIFKKSQRAVVEFKLSKLQIDVYLNKSKLFTLYIIVKQISLDETLIGNAKFILSVVKPW